MKEHMLRLPVMVHAHLKRLSEQTGLGMAEHVRRALEPYLVIHPISLDGIIIVDDPDVPDTPNTSEQQSKLNKWLQEPLIKAI